MINRLFVSVLLIVFYQVVSGKADITQVGESGRNHVKDVIPRRDIQRRNKHGHKVQCHNRTDD